MVPTLRSLLVVSAMLLTAGPLAAATRLTSHVNGALVPVEWKASSFPIAYKTDQRLIAALPGGAAVLERAFGVWTSAPNSNVSFRSAGVEPGLRAGKDNQSVITLTDELFNDQKAIAIAITTTWDQGGIITEADIQIDASLVNGSYNIPQAIAHEIGHLLGLDHSGVLSAAMYPYVTRGTDAPALDSDDRIAIANIYPKGDLTMAGGTLQGRVVGDSGGIFAAQVVAVNEEGEPVATVLTDASGGFSLAGMPDGTYRIYVEPLDGPVETRNLSPAWRQGIVSAFATSFIEGNPIKVESGRVYGNLVVRTRGGAVELNPRWIGIAAANASEFALTSTAATVTPGTTISLAVAGDGIFSAMTTFEVLSPGFRRVSDYRYAGNYVYANYEVGSSAAAGSAVIVVTSGTQTATLTGALRVQGGAGAGPGRVRGVRG